MQNRIDHSEIISNTRFKLDSNKSNRRLSTKKKKIFYNSGYEKNRNNFWTFSDDVERFKIFYDSNLRIFACENRFFILYVLI